MSAARRDECIEIVLSPEGQTPAHLRRENS
jgi:hypothetical protein